jgi:DNA repair protein RadC
MKFLKGALLVNVRAIILVHNYLSGNTEPSQADKIATKNLIKSGNILDINVIDHVIIGSQGMFFSFSQEGILNTQMSWACFNESIIIIHLFSFF